MNSISTDSSTPTVASVRRTQEAERNRAAGTAPSEPSAADTPPRPSTVVNLNSSARQAALNGLTYGTLRGHAAARNTPSDDANRVARDTREIQGSSRAERTERSEHAEQRAEVQGQNERQQERQAVERQVAERQSNDHRTVQRQDDQAVQAIQSASQAETAERV